MKRESIQPYQKIDKPMLYNTFIFSSLTFFMATGLTSMSFVLEKKEGLLDRGIVAGVGYIEVMISHMCTQFLILAVQVGLLLVFALLVFKVRRF